VFFARSPRFLTPEAAGDIIRQLPPFVARVGVFVNATAEEIQRTLEISGINVVQLHGDEPPDFARHFSVPVIRAVRVKDESSFGGLSDLQCSAVLLDSFTQGQEGGTGRKFDWELAARAKGRGRAILLAGGLTPENVAEAIAIARPYGVDVSSGVESAPGRKDHEKVKRFISRAKAA
jgi:phosphoribosylanthranilate isomerase